MIIHRPSVDVYAKVLRTYQCLFQLLLTQLLLDDNFRIGSLHISRRLGRYCKDPARPTRSDIDLAAIVTHTTLSCLFEGHDWSGFSVGHPLENVCRQSIELYDQVVEARHNLLYRPFLLERQGRWYWEDCSLDDLVSTLPEAEKLERAYLNFSEAVTNWTAHESIDTLPLATLFLASLRRLYDDSRGRRPTMTLLPSYALLLNRGDQQLMARVREYALKTFSIIMR